MDSLTSSEIEEFLIHSSVNTIKLYCLYISQDSVLEKITTTEVKLNTNNLLTKPEIKYLIKQNERFNNDKFKIISIFKHNVNDAPQNIVSTDFKSTFLHKELEINSINFNKTSLIFMDLNCLFFVYYKLPQKKPQLVTTKKLFISSNSKTKKHLIK